MWNGETCLHEPSPFRRSNRGDLAPTFDSTLIMAVLRRHLSRGWTQSTDAQQVVGGAREIQQLGVASYAAQPRLAQPADGLTPAEELLDTLAHDLARPVGGRFEHTASQADRVIGIAGHVSGGTLLDQRRDEPLGVITLICTHTLGSNMLAPLAREHGKRRLRLGDAHRSGKRHIAHEAMAVIYQRVSGKAELGFLAQTFAQELRLRVRGARMGGVRAPLTLEVPIASGIRARSAAVLALIRLHRRPCFDQRAVDTKVLVRQQLQAPRFAHHGIEELHSNLFAREALAVLAEGGGIEGGFLQTHIQEPAKQDVVVERLAKEPITPDRIQCDQKLRLQQPLRRNRRPTNLAIQPIEQRTNLLQCRLRIGLDRAQRMPGWNPFLGREVTEQMRLRIYMTTHQCISRSLPKQLHSTHMPKNKLFQQPASG